MSEFLTTALEAAHEAGKLLRAHFGTALKVNAFESHDIKLDLDVRSQELITEKLLSAFPTHAIYGEEGLTGDQNSEFQWIVDPIDGTVNYFYGFPHFCISIALRQRGEIITGVIYDPIRDELWQAEKGGPALLNGRPIQVSTRTQLSEAMLSVGFSKTKTTIGSGMALFENMVYRARKCRLMGSAALDLAYVACGRLDAYIESSVSLWDIAAGQLIIECAGGKVDVKPHPENADKLSIVGSSGNIDLELS